MYPGGRAPANSLGVLEGVPGYEARQIIDDDQLAEFVVSDADMPVVIDKNPVANLGGLGEVSSAERNATQRPPRFRLFVDWAVQEWSREPGLSGLHQNIGSRALVVDESKPRQTPYYEQLRTARNLPDAAWDSGYVIGESDQTLYNGGGIGGV